MKQRDLALSSIELMTWRYQSLRTRLYGLRNSMEACQDNLDDTHNIFKDNPGAIAPVKFYQRIKHIDIRQHFVARKLKTSQVVLEYVSTTDMPAEFLSKTFTCKKFSALCEASISMGELIGGVVGESFCHSGYHVYRSTYRFKQACVCKDKRLSVSNLEIQCSGS
ncbi:hypothetical protein Plhal304r1_c002g0006041 [Plasmopara halstedii]